MNNKKNYRKGARREIIRLLFLNGVLTYKSMQVMQDTRQMTGRAVKKLESEGVIEISKGPLRVTLRDHALTALRKNEIAEKHSRDEAGGLTARDDSIQSGEGTPVVNLEYQNFRENIETYPEEVGYLDAVSEGQVAYYRQNIAYSVKNVKGTSKNYYQKFIRMIRNSEVNTLVYSTGAKIMADEKPDIIRTTDRVYYSSVEIKRGREDRDDGKAISNERSHGVLVSPGGLYMMYHTGNAMIKWSSFSEIGGCIRTMRFLKERADEEWCMKNEQIEVAVVLADNPTVFSRMVTYDGKVKSSNGMKNMLLAIEPAYKTLYGITNDLNGRKMLGYMQDAGWRTRMKQLFLTHEEIEESKFCSIACDGYDKENSLYTLLFCIPDLIKLRNFCMRAELNQQPDNYRIICFTHQLPTIANIISNNDCKVYSVPFERYEQLTYQQQGREVEN